MIDSLRRASNRALSVFRSRGLDADLDAEILCHIDAAVAENIHRGMEPGEARRFALVRFGGLAQAKQQQRETRGLPALDALRQDIRLSLRMLKRDRAFACIVIFVLALGIGANVAVFSVVNNILLRPLPFRDANRLVWLATNEGKGGLSSQTYTVAAFEEFRKHNNPSRTSPLTRLSSAPSVPDRLFTAEECRRGAPAVALLSYGFWQRQFGGDPSIAGRTLTIDAAPAEITGPVTVVGVLPGSFDFGSVFSPGMQVDFSCPRIWICGAPGERRWP